MRGAVFAAVLTVVASLDPVPSVIGTGLSQAKLTSNETEFFSHMVSSEGQWAYLNHFWAAGNDQVDRALFRYYIDGETEASVVFTPALATGVGFGDQSAPWGNKWMGKGAKSTGWFHNIPVPFYKSVRVTFQLAPEDEGSSPTLWTIVRGAEGLPMHLGNLELPLSQGSVKLDLQKRDAQLQPLDFYDMAVVPSGLAGTVFLTSLFVNGTSNYNYMEGCFHFYSPASQAWPGTLLATGMEDFYDSAFYFNGGGFHLPVSGMTHKPGDGTFSGYRFHEMDPLVFKDGARMQWRNGDVTDESTGLKCTLQSGGIPAGGSPGHPGPSAVSSYSWVYTWKPAPAHRIEV
jgi:hypothetical protein